MSLLSFCTLYVPLELHTLLEHDALAAQNALLILVCNTKHIYFCRESALNLIATSWQLDPPHVSSVSFEPVLASWYC